MVLAVVAAMGPWFTDTHPATEETCLTPLVWLGNGRCACLVSFIAALGQAVIPGQASLLVLLLPPLLPLITTFVILFVKERRYLWIGHLAVWALAGAFVLFLFFRIRYSYHEVRLWGAALYGMVAVTMVAGEILLASVPPTGSLAHPARVRPKGLPGQPERGP